MKECRAAAYAAIEGKELIISHFQSFYFPEKLKTLLRVKLSAASIKTLRAARKRSQEESESVSRA